MLVISTHGPEDVEKATLPFIVANTAATMDVKCTVFLMGAAVELAKKGLKETLPEITDMPKVSDLIDSFLAQGGEILLCGPCCKHRHMDGESIIEGSRIGGASGLVDMALDRKVLTF